MPRFPTEKDPVRLDDMKSMFVQGFTHQQIGQKYDISRQRVCQCLEEFPNLLVEKLAYQESKLKEALKTEIETIHEENSRISVDRLSKRLHASSNRIRRLLEKDPELQELYDNNKFHALDFSLLKSG